MTVPALGEPRPEPRSELCWWSGELLDRALEAQYRRFKLPAFRRMGFLVAALILVTCAVYLPVDVQTPQDVRALILPVRMSLIAMAALVIALLGRGGDVRFCEIVIAGMMGAFYVGSTVILQLHPLGDLYFVARCFALIIVGTVLWQGSPRVGWALNAPFALACFLQILVLGEQNHDLPTRPVVAAALFLVIFAGGTAFGLVQQRAARRDYLRFQRERRLRAELDHKRREAEAATRAKSEFLAIMSHEIRTPMNGMVGMLGLALDKPMTPDLREDLTAAHAAAGDLLVLLNGVLDFSKLEAGKAVGERAPFDLPRLIRDAVTLMEAQALTKGLRVTVEIEPALPRVVSGDAGKIRQVLRNLVGNAIKFTDAGGVAVRAVARSRDALGRLQVEVSVADTGIGIDDSVRATLFQAFSQVDASIARRFGGTGLGLAICRKLVEAMGGDIGFDSAPGRGSRFWFRLPLEVAAPAEAPPRPSPPAALRPLRVLLAEDSTVNQKVVIGLMKLHGHAVTAVAANGMEAVEQAAAGGFDLVLMDMRMPFMDGLAAARAIRALPDAAGRVPIIALTANVLRADGDACRAAGMNGHVAKPIDPDALFQAIAAALEGGPR